MAEEDYRLFLLMHRIADIVFELRGDRFLVDQRHTEANPFYNQTRSGLFLEASGGWVPNVLWTPWGQWNFGGSGSAAMEEVLRELLERLGATTHEALQTVKGVTIAPVFALHRVDEETLPKPITHLRYVDFKTYEQAKQEWGEMTKQYRSGQH